MRFITLLIATVFTFIFLQNVQSSTRAKIEIVKLVEEDGLYRMKIVIDNASSELRVTDILIFSESKDSVGLSIVTDKTGKPYIVDTLDGRVWNAQFLLQKSSKALYAIAISRKSYANWSKIRDIDALKRLGVEQKSTINEVLALLFDFGWTPKGYTYIGVTSYRSDTGGGRTNIDQSNTSNVCQTNAGACSISGYAKNGEQCFCKTPNGSVDGVIVPQY